MSKKYIKFEMSSLWYLKIDNHSKKQTATWIPSLHWGQSIWQPTNAWREREREREECS
jgi:hypothetical protein